MPTIGILVPTDGSAPALPPEERPIGRAALCLASEGIDVVFGAHVIQRTITGHRAIPGGWEAVSGLPLDAAHDRFPSQVRASTWSQIATELDGLPMSNPMEFTLLCRDKVQSQHALEAQGIQMPDVEAEPNRFEAQLAKWNSGFLKPRYGALGVGVHRVEPGDTMPTMLPGVVPHRPDPAILQRAVQSPSGWAGRTVRVLVQRTETGGWWHGVPVLRQSREDPVCNAARGAQVVAGPAQLDESTLLHIQQLCDAVCAAFDRMPAAKRMVEAGLDLVLDEQHLPHLIEVNSRPRGRMEHLAGIDPSNHRAAHVDACARPLRVLSRWIS